MITNVENADRMNELFASLSLTLAEIVVKARGDKKAHDVTIELAEDINKMWVTDTDEEFETLWPRLAARYGFRIDDDSEDVWMCVRLSSLDRAGVPY